MARIHVLDEQTINKIAAGEVVERPASVIKELVENAIDAGASSIQVAIADGGISYMRITDNGCGMTEEDARLAVLRHATSKIQQVEDLYEIASLGFRGEALASISAVSHFSLTTRTVDQELGTRITVDGGSVIDCSPYGAALGTTIEVCDLFYNTPARRKFLKTERTETSKIQDIVGKLALSNPHIAFTLMVDDKMSIITPGKGNLMETVRALYGFSSSDDLFPVAYENENIIVEGIVSKPTLLKSSRQWQTVIVNNRVITDKTVWKAIDNAYHALLPKTGHPLVVLTITVPPDLVDINVHPRKSEVKFHDDKVVYRAVYHGVLGAIDNPLQSDDTKPELIATSVQYDKVFAHGTGYDIVGEEEATQPFMDKRESTNAFVDSIRESGFTPAPRITYEQPSLGMPFEDVTTSYASYTTEDKEKLAFIQEQRITPAGGLEPPRMIQNSGFLPLGQVASCYILAKKGDDLFIIDQHAAHERVRYDFLCKSSAAIPMQDLLVPVFINSNEEDMQIVEDNRDILLDLGFDVELGGPTQLKVVASPVDIVESKVEDVLTHVFTYLHDQEQPTKASMRHEMLAYASCRGAIKSGHTLNMYQMSRLIEDLFHTDKPYVCPHGRPTIIKFTPQELGKLFLRS